MSNGQLKGYDPRKAEWNGTPIDAWEPSQYKKWKPKHTGTDYCVNMEREYLRMRFAVQQANQRLDSKNVRVKIKLTNHKSIGLQGTFPCRQGDIGKNGSPNKQYTISFGHPANDGGIKAAEQKANDLGWLLTIGQFRWTPELLGRQSQKITAPNEVQPAKLVSELVKEYEKEFWKTRDKKNRKDITNWQKNYVKFFKKFPSDVPLSDEVLIQVIETTRPNTPTRKQILEVLKRFCKFVDFPDKEIVKFRIQPGKIKKTPRTLPTDEQIVLGFEQINQSLDSRSNKNTTQPEQWQWAYGMLATYGLRPHELWAIDLDYFTSPSNTLHLVQLDPELTEGTKTGERNGGVPPLNPEWVQLFDLKNPKIIALNATFLARTNMLCRRFKRVEIGFRPYDLRHAYAIRGHRLCIPIKAMADFMGHTVREHTDTYQRWMAEDVNKELYREAVLKQELTKEAMTSKIVRLEDENAALKAENELIKRLLTQRQLDELFSC